MKTAVIYARYSSDRQTEQSIDGQIHVCMEYAERKYSRKTRKDTDTGA